MPYLDKDFKPTIFEYTNVNDYNRLLVYYPRKGGKGVPNCDFTYEILVTPTPTPTSSITPTPSITPSITPTSSITPTPTPSSSSISLDPDAAAYLADVVASGGTTNPTIESAVDTLFTSLKSNGLYSKMILFYPFVGGTSGSHSVMGIRASGSTYDLSMVGGMTHGVSGATGNGTNSGMNTKYDSSNLPFDRSMGAYISSADLTTHYDMGGGNGAENMIIISYGPSGLGYIGFGAYKTYDPTIVGDRNGGNIVGTITGTTYNGWKNGTQVITNSTGTNNRSNRYLSLLCDNRALIPSFNTLESSSSTMAFTFYSQYLTDSEATTLSTIINTFQTSLGRNIY